MCEQRHLSRSCLFVLFILIWQFKQPYLHVMRLVLINVKPTNLSLVDMNSNHDSEITFSITVQQDWMDYSRKSYSDCLPIVWNAWVMPSYSLIYPLALFTCYRYACNFIPFPREDCSYLISYCTTCKAK